MHGREARLQADRANKESKREAETEDARILRLQDNPQRSWIHANVHRHGLVVLTALKEATNTQAFTGDLTRAIDDDHSLRGSDVSR